MPTDNERLKERALSTNTLNRNVGYVLLVGENRRICSQKVWQWKAGWQGAVTVLTPRVATMWPLRGLECSWALESMGELKKHSLQQWNQVRGHREGVLKVLGDPRGTAALWDLWGPLRTWTRSRGNSICKEPREKKRHSPRGQKGETWAIQSGQRKRS